MLSIIASIALGCVMCGAGAAKIAMGRGWSNSAESMGSPRWVVPFVPWIEITIGAALIAQWQRRASAVSAGFVLVSFTVLIMANLLRGRRPQCACFGTWSTRRLGWGHVVRNVALLALAAVAAI